MPGEEAGELPRAQPQECRREAERFLGMGQVDVDVPQATAWALLAVAGELHEIRRILNRRR